MRKSKCDQDGDENAKRRHEINHGGNYIDQVLSDSDEGNTIPDDVAQQLEKREYQRKHNECAKNQSQILEELAKHVIVEDLGEAGASLAQRGGNR